MRPGSVFLKTLLLAVILTPVETWAQQTFSCSGPNLLVNGSFESPVVANGNGANNIVGAIPNWTNASVVTTSVNIVKPTGVSNGGPAIPANGAQYIDLQGSTGIMDQSFTLSSPAAVHFSGKFTNRVYNDPSYTGGQIGVQIFDANAVQVAVVTGSLSAADAYNWKTLSGITTVLPAGTYTFRFFARTDWAHYDDMSVCVATNAATNCTNKIVMTNPGTWTATASGNLANWPVSKIIDGSVNDIANNAWASPTTSPAGAYVTVDYGAAMDLVGFVYYPRYNTELQDIAEYSVQYSNDGTNFTTIQRSYLTRQQNVYATPTGNPIEVNFTTAVNARYLRLVVHTTHVANNYACILELLPIVCTSPALPVIGCTDANLLNSGTTATGIGKKAANTFDNNWTVAYARGRSGLNNTSVATRTFLPALVVGNKAPGGWINSPYANAEWISYTMTGIDVNSTGAGDGTSNNTYFYKYKFNITDPYLLAAFKLKIDFYVDNRVDNIYVNGISYAASLGLPTGSFTAGSQVSATLKNGWQLGENEILLQTWSAPGNNGFLIQNMTTCNGIDFGDAPASYNVTKAGNGPGHIIETTQTGTVTLKLGANVDAEADGIASAGDNDDNTGSLDDEDGMTATFPGIPSGANPAVTNYTVTLAVSNNTGSAANLCGWIDWNVNGTFDAGEGVCTTVPNGATSASLVWPSATFNGTAGTTSTYARFRITSDALTGSSPNGAASNGEVEDYLVNFPPVCVTKVVQPTGLGWTVTASATGAGAANQIVDGSFATTGWVSPASPAGSYVTINYGAPLDLTGFVYYPRKDSVYQDINGYTVQYSNDGTAFTTIQSGNFPAQGRDGLTRGAGNPMIVSFSGTFTAQYLRLIVNSTHQGGTTAAGISEILPVVCQVPADPEISCMNANTLNTGTTAAGTGKSATNIFDRNWEVAGIANNTAANYATISNAIFVPAIVTGNKIPGAWDNSPFGNADWIAYTPTGYDFYWGGGNTSPNDYFFRYKFTISDPYQLPGFSLKLNFMADNQVENVYINGISQAPQTGLPQSPTNKYQYGGFMLANQAQTTLQKNWQLGTNEIIVHVKSYPGAAGFIGQNTTSCPGLDFGDAPASYNVPKALNGPGHMIEMNPAGVVTLKMGANIDAENDGASSLIANNDDITGTADEDGVTTPVIQANYCTVINYNVSVNATNITGKAANLVGWIDWDGSGTFDASEGVSAIVPANTNGGNIVLNWPLVNVGVPDTTTYLFARFRLSTDSLTTATPNGVASNGEVEDYMIPITWIPYDFGNLSVTTWPVAVASITTGNAAWLGIDTATKECLTITTDPADGFRITNANGGSGTSTDPWLLGGTGASYNCELTVNGNGAPKPVYWAMWYDVNGNGSFTDARDIFQTGSLVHGSPVSTTFSLGIPKGNGETFGVIRVIATAVNPNFTQAMNGTGNFTNGEVEDYYVTYQAPLPLQLARFTASKKGNNSLLEWTTVNEQNTHAFTVEHSTDGKVFSAVSEVAAAGNSVTDRSYTYLHQQPGNGTHHYRLKMEDKDGRFRYSEIRVLNFGGYNEVLLYPNPVTSQATMTGLAGDEQIRIIGADGRIEIMQTVSGNTELIDMSSLPQGLHLVQVLRQGGVITVIKVNKR